MSESLSLPAGIYPYLVSPVNADGSIREDTLGRLIDDLIKAGVQGVTPLGSTGEVSYLTTAQRRRIVEVTLDAAAGRVPVVPGIAAFSSHDAVEQARLYERLGSAGLVVMRQNAGPVNEAGVQSYFATTSRAVSLPIRLTIVPGDMTFTPLGTSASGNVGPGEFAYVDDGGRVICRLDVIQADFSKVTAATTGVVVIVEGTSSHDGAGFSAARTELVELIGEFCGGSAA